MGLKIGFLVTAALLLTSCFEATSVKKERTQQKAQPTKNETYQPKAPTAQQLACANETCGAASKLPYLSAQPKEQDRAFYKQNIEASLIQYVNLSVRYAGLKNKIVNDFSNMQVDRISESYLALINYLHFASFSDAISESLEEKSYGIGVNTASLRQNLMKAGIAQEPMIKWVTLVAQTIYESDLFYTNFQLSQYPLEIFVQRQYAGRDALDGIAIEAEKLLAIQEKVNEAFPIFKPQSVGKIEIFKKAMRKEPLDPDEKEDFVDERMNLNSLKEMLPNGKWRSVILSRPTNVPTLVADLLKKAKTSDLLKTNDAKLKNEGQNYFHQCTFYLLTNIASSPNPEQNTHFANMIQGLKSDAKHVLERSGYLTSQISSSIDKIRIVLPATKQQTTAALSRALNNEIQTGNQGIELLSNLDIRSQEDKELVALLLASQYADTDKDETALSSIKEFCQEHAAPQISDAAYMAYQLVNIGWRSVLYPNYGYGIASHELAHVISYLDQFSSRAVFQRVKSCLKENQNNSKDFIEEDFADTFAVQMLKQKPQAGNSNFSCLLLDQDGYEYTNLQMSTYSGANHSSNFYRLISVGTEIGGMGPSCQAAKQQSPTGLLVRNCWGR